MYLMYYLDTNGDRVYTLKVIKYLKLSHKHILLQAQTLFLDFTAFLTCLYFRYFLIPLSIIVLYNQFTLIFHVLFT